MLTAAPPVRCAPGAICSVARETASHGWPHEATIPELVDVSSRVFLRYGPGPYSTGHCDFDSNMMGPATCLVRPDLGSRRIRVRVLVNPDGTYSMWPVQAWRVVHTAWSRTPAQWLSAVGR